jgi:hemolysin activation/secretion protein
MLLLAQMIAPPLQPGPIRLPEPAPIDRFRPRPDAGNDDDKTPLIDPGPTPPAPSSGPGEGTGRPTSQPAVKGNSFYSPEQLRQIFAGCSRVTPAATLQACAAALSARFVADGYVNTRVYILATPAPGALEVVPGRIAELRIDNPDPRFAARIRRLLLPLQGSVLNLPQLDRQIQRLKRWPGIGTVRGSIGRVGSDATLASLTLRVDRRIDPLQGEVSLRNDGNAGNGQWRAVGTVLQNDLMSRGDTLLIYGEGDMDDTPELGTVITSISYGYPLTDNLRLTGSFGYSRRNLVEGVLAPQQWSFRQFQGYGQLEWVFNETLSQRWSLFSGISVNRNDSFAAGRPFPLLNGFKTVNTNTGYFRFGVAVSGVEDNASWTVSLYGLQGANGFSPENQLRNLSALGVIPGEATALGGSAGVSLALAANTTMNLRGAGQIALNPLIADMGFTIGSDSGIRGLPGQTISGDSGYLGSAEIAWTIWRKARQAIQLVPFIGYGGVSRTRLGNINALRYNNSIGAGGILARFLAGSTWQVELGWVGQIDHLDQLDNAIWGSDYFLGRGLYTTIKYRF